MSQKQIINKIYDALLTNGDVISEPQLKVIETANKNGWDTIRINPLYHCGEIDILCFMRGEPHRLFTAHAIVLANGVVEQVDYFYNRKVFKRSEVHFDGSGKSYYYDPTLKIERETVAYLDGYSDNGVKTIVNHTRYNDIFLSPNGLALNPAINAFA